MEQVTTAHCVAHALIDSGPVTALKPKLRPVLEHSVSFAGDVVVMRLSVR